MKTKMLTGAACALSLGLALTTTTITPASAGSGGFVAGLIGGAAVGAIAGTALAGPRYYAPPPVYVAPAPVEYEPACWTERRPVYDADGYPAGSRPVRICR